MTENRNPIDPNDVLALLEDGPKQTHELAGWITWKGCRGLKELARQGVIADLSEPLTPWRDRLWAMPQPVAPAVAAALTTDRILERLADGPMLFKTLAQELGVSRQELRPTVRQMQIAGVLRRLLDNRVAIAAHRTAKERYEAELPPSFPLTANPGADAPSESGQTFKVIDGVEYECFDLTELTRRKDAQREAERGLAQPRGSSLSGEMPWADPR